MMKPCFWCDKLIYHKNLTKDHILPRHCGGNSNPINIVPSCYSCNNERGKLYSIWLYYRGERIELTGRYRDRAIFNFLKYSLLYRKWVDLEQQKLGYSPSSCYKPSVIFITKEISECRG